MALRRVRHRTATIGAETYALDPGSLVVIDPGEATEIRNDGDASLMAIDGYAPPEY